MSEKQTRPKSSKAFKWFIIICWIGFLGFIIIPSLLAPNHPVKARVIVTEADLKSLHAAVNMFQLDTGRYPTQEKGLLELVEKPADVDGWTEGGYLETTDVPRDAWKHEFVYQLTPESEHPFVILSYGADGQPGGEDYDADLYSTDGVK